MRNLIVAALAAWIALPSASATPICTTATLDVYLGSACNIGSVLFNFGAGVGLYHYSQGDQGNVPDTAVTVTPVDTASAQGEQFGFTFTGPWTANCVTVADPTCASGPDSPDIFLSFGAQLVGVPASVYFATGTLSLGISLVDQSGVDSGFLPVESFSTFGSVPMGGIALTILEPTDPTSGTVLMGLQSQNVDVTKDLPLTGGAVGDHATILSFTETFTLAAPEPGVAMLVAAGLILLLVVRRWKRLALPLVGVCALLGLGASSAHASAVACTDVTDIGGTSLANYLNISSSFSGTQGQCTLSGVLFTFVSYSDTLANSATPPASADASAIMVSPTALQPTNPGFQFVPNITYNSSNTLTLSLVISAQAIGPVGIEGVATAANGNASCHNNVCGAFGGQTTSTAGGIDIPYITNGQMLQGGLQLTTPAVLPLTTTMTLTDVLTLTGGGNLASSDHVSGLSLNIGLDPPGLSTPEPIGFLLIGGSLVALAVSVRRKKPSWRSADRRPAGSDPAGQKHSEADQAVAVN